MENTKCIVVAGIEESAIKKDVGRISAIQACAEYVDNQFDAGSLQGEIFTDRAVKPNVVCFLDQGSGMSMRSIQAFFTYGQSEWRTKRHKGANGKGSKFMLSHAEKIVVRTRCENDEYVKTFTIDLESWLDQILKGREVEIDTHATVGSHPMDPESGSFTLFEIYPNDDKKSFFSEKHLLENLGELLSPQFADRVFVNGKTLKPRDIIGGFEFEATDPVLGDVRVFMYQPTTVKSRDVLRIGSIGPVMDFRTFTDGLPRKLREKVPSIFFDRTVCGLIEVEAFNQWREGASREFRNDLYQSEELELFVDFLESILGPKVATEFGLNEVAIADKEKRNLDALRDLSERAFGEIEIFEEKKPVVKSSSFAITPWTLTISPGETQVFKVRGRSGETYTFDFSKIPGATAVNVGENEVTLKIGKRVDFNPDEQYHLKVTQDSTGKTKIAYIKIAVTKELSIVPKSGSYYIGDRINLRAVNVPGDSKKLNWSINPEASGRLTENTSLTGVGLIANTTGRCKITVSDPDNKSVHATSTIYISEKPAERKRENPDGPMIKIEDVVIVIKTLHTPSLEQGFFEKVSDNLLTFHLNPEHPKYHATMKVSESAWREYILSLIVTYYVFWKAEKDLLSRDEQQLLISSIMAVLI